MSASGRASAGQRRSEKLGVLGRPAFLSSVGLLFFFSSVLLLFLAIYILHSDSIKQDELVADVPEP